MRAPKVLIPRQWLMRSVIQMMTARIGTPPFALGKAQSLKPYCVSTSLSPRTSQLACTARKENTRSEEQSSSRDREAERPSLQESGLGTLSDFAVETRQEDTIGAQVEESLTPFKYFIWIAGLLGAIGVFYGLVFAASGSLSNFLKDKATFTRKDFIPYSEKRRLQQEAAAKEQERLGISQEGRDGVPDAANPASHLSEFRSSFNQLLPGS